MEKADADKVADELERSSQFIAGVSELAEKLEIPPEIMFSLYGLMAKAYSDDLRREGMPEAQAMTTGLNWFLMGLGARRVSLGDVPPELAEEMKESMVAAMRKNKAVH